MNNIFLMINAIYKKLFLYKYNYLMELQERLESFAELGYFMQNKFLLVNESKIQDITLVNPWFTRKNIEFAIEAWAFQLDRNMLLSWLTPYKLEESDNNKKILIILAGNIPLVGFHDFLSVLMSGHHVAIKMATKDDILFPLIINKLLEISPNFKKRIDFISDVRYKQFDAVIATGNDHSARYFEYYFKNFRFAPWSLL